jgi:hypothetical protein
MDQPQCVTYYNPDGNGKDLYCVMFDSWTQLVAYINTSAYSNTTTSINNLANVADLSVKPSRPITLTGELDLWTICYGMFTLPESTIWNTFIVYTSGLRGIDTTRAWTSSMFNSLAELENIYLIVYSSKIEFFIDGKTGYNFMTLNQFMSDYGVNFTNAPTFFNYYTNIVFKSSVVFEQTAPPWCPFIFTHARLYQFDIAGLADSFLVKNLYQFQQTQQTNSTINSTILELQLRGYNFKLDESLLQPLVFEQIHTLGLSGTISSIQIDVLVSYRSSS